MSISISTSMYIYEAVTDFTAYASMKLSVEHCHVPGYSTLAPDT